ncbi:MAG: hypothetical protein R3D26_20260 [Cyanobacteriota/Melainabacteria group bacterium]
MAVGESNQKARAAAVYFAAGFWLGVSQVALGFHLLYSQGAAVIYYFALVSVWLAGSVIALVAIKSKFKGVYLGSGCLLVLFGAFTAARLEPFGSMSLLVLLLSGLVQGVFAGWFLKSRIACGGSVSSVMLHENNKASLSAMLRAGAGFLFLNQQPRICSHWGRGFYGKCWWKLWRRELRIAVKAK